MDRALTPAQIDGYRRRKIDYARQRRAVVCRQSGERWESLKAAARALGYRQTTTIWWHLKQRTPARGGRMLEYAANGKAEGRRR
jgi:hypothetical protein